MPIGIRQVSVLGYSSREYCESGCFSTGIQVQVWCLQFSKHVLDLGRSKPRKTIERTGEPQAVQFKGAAEHLPDHEVHITACAAKSLCGEVPLDL